MKNRKLLISLIALSTLASGTQSARLKELINIRGVRPNKLLGYGVVFGLAGTGDTQASLTTRQTVAHMMNQIGIRVTPDQLVAGNFASVLATAELPPFARGGDRLDVRLSANSDASSFAGGTLMMTPLRAGDGEIYAVAQGPVVLGQATGTGASVLTVARLPGGAQVEKEFIPDYAPDMKVTLSLKKMDFTTSKRISEVINKHFRGFYASSGDPGTVTVHIPAPFQGKKVEFLSELENLRVSMDQKAVVVLNERTGTVVMGNGVSVGPVTIAHGDLSVRVAQGGGKSGGPKNLMAVDGVTVGEVIESLNQLGVKPADLVSILQAISAAGALHGELIFI